MDQQVFLQQPEEVKASYLVLLSAVATADHENSDEEIAFMEQMAAIAGLSDNSVEQVKDAMKNPQSIDFKAHLSSFGDNELKYSLITDFLNLSYKDGELEEEEVAQIKKANDLLGINDEQFEALKQYVQAANKEVEEMDGNPVIDENGEPKEMPNNFLEKTGLADTFKKANIPTNNFSKGTLVSTVLAGAASYFIKSMLSGKQGQNQGGMSGMLGGLLGNLMGGGQQTQNPQNTGGNAGGGLGGLLGSMLGGGGQGGSGQGNLGGLLSTVIAASGKGKGLGNLVDMIGGGTKKQGSTGGGALGNILGSLLSGK